MPPAGRGRYRRACSAAGERSRSLCSGDAPVRITPVWRALERIRKEGCSSSDMLAYRLATQRIHPGVRALRSTRCREALEPTPTSWRSLPAA